MKSRLGFILLLLLPGLAACSETRTAPPQVTRLQSTATALDLRDEALERLVADYDRLIRVAHPLLIGAVGLCAEDWTPDLGFSIWNLDLLAEPWRGTLLRGEGLQQGVSVAGLVSGTTAAQAGLKRHDLIVQLGGIPFRPGSGTTPGFSGRVAAVIKAGQPLALTVERGGVTYDLTYRPEARCDIGLVLRPGGEGGFILDGRNIVVDHALLTAVPDDHRLATLLAHAMAHHAMAHPWGRSANDRAGLSAGPLFDLAAGAFGRYPAGEAPRVGRGIRTKPYYGALEREADYVGLYFMALAGYPLAEAEAFWRDLDTGGEGVASLAERHPPSAERLVGIELAAKEIRAKIAAGEALVPRGLEGLSAALLQPRGFAGALLSADRAKDAETPDRWTGQGAADACGVVWALELVVEEGVVAGSLRRGGLFYDVAGQVSDDGRLIAGRAGRGQRSGEVSGPRLLAFEVAVSSFGAEGFIAVESAGGLKCRTDVRLAKVN